MSLRKQLNRMSTHRRETHSFVASPVETEIKTARVVKPCKLLLMRSGVGPHPFLDPRGVGVGYRVGLFK